jgi:hypothetical protein
VKAKLSVSSNQPSKLAGVFWPLAIIAAAIAALFWRSFLPEYVHFSNDGPLGAQNVNYGRLPAGFTGMWNDLNLIGANGGTAGPGISVTIRWFFGAVGYAKFYQPFGLFLLGAGAWAFFRALKLTPMAALLGGLATALNTAFFAGACWGIAAAEIAIGFNFCALALVMANDDSTPARLRYLRLMLAGFCVGVNVMEAADVGALCSIFIAGYVFYKSLVQSGIPFATRIIRGVSNVAVVAICAGFLAVQVVTSLMGQGLTGTGAKATEETPQAHWDWATQWSLPKAETLGAIIPGLFGYRMDTPNKLLPKSLEESYRGGVYWGGVGRTPEVDRFFDSGAEGSPPPGMMRFGYAGYYCGILVILIALWGVAQLFRKQNPVYAPEQKMLVAFWSVAMLVMIYLAWGRFAPGSRNYDGLMGYALLYKLPHFSDIRNPAKFFLFFIWAVTVLFAYGMDNLSRRHLVDHIVPGKKTADGFDRKLTFGLIGILVAGVVGWFIYAGNKPALIGYLQKVGYGNENTAEEIAGFSIGQVGWFAGFLVVAGGLLLLIVKGYFSGSRAKLGALLIGVFIFIDLGRSNLPFIIHWDYKHKYEVGTLNPILDFLRKNPWEHRVSGPEEGHGVGIPFSPQRQLRLYDNYFFNGGVYSIEWTQHHYLFYNIQSLDIIQMPRVAGDIGQYLRALSPRSQSEAWLRARFWQLTNTRYLLGAVDYVGAMNQLLDPQQNRFRIAQRFDIVAKPDITKPEGLEDLTAAAAPDGDLALIEFTGALPRAKLYSNWLVNTNDDETLATLAAPEFDPIKTVLISTPQKDLPAVSTNENSGTVEFKSYSTKKIVFTANATAPSVMLLNDKYDPNWRVTVDGKPAELLRCNFIMRGVQLSPGQHTVQFDFSMPNQPLFITLAAIIIALILAALLVFMTRKPQTPDSK